jgi:hypothetical protein
VHGVRPRPQLIEGHLFNANANEQSCYEHHRKGPAVWVCIPLKAIEPNPANHENQPDQNASA